MKNESVFRPALLLMAGRIVAFAATFFIPVVLVRIFDQADFGTYRQLFLIHTTLFLVAQVGMAESLFYFVPRAPGQAGRHVANALLTLTAAGLVSAALLWTAAPTVARWMGNPRMPSLLGLLGVYLVLTLAANVLEIVLTARNRFRSAAVSYAGSDLLRAALLILPGLLFRRLDWVLAGAVAFAFLRLLATLLYLRAEFGPELRPDRVWLSGQLAYALPFAGVVLMETLQAQFHQYAVAVHFDPAAFAIYSVGCLQIPFTELVASPACNVMMVRMSEEIREGRGSSVVALWRDVSRKLALVLAPLTGLLLVGAHDLIALLYTDAYLASAPIFMVWSAALMLSALQSDGVLRVFAQNRFLFGLNLARLALIVAGIGWFMSAFGLLGAVLATVAIAFLAKAAALVRMARLMDTGLRGLLPWGGLGATVAVAAAAAVPALATRWLLLSQAGHLVALVAVSGVYCATYLAFLLRLGLVREGERLALMAWLPRPRALVAAAVRRS